MEGFTVELEGGRRVHGVRVGSAADLERVGEELEVGRRPVLVVVGGASRMSAWILVTLRPMLPISEDAEGRRGRPLVTAGLVAAMVLIGLATGSALGSVLGQLLRTTPAERKTRQPCACSAE